MGPLRPSTRYIRTPPSPRKVPLSLPSSRFHTLLAEPPSQPLPPFAQTPTQRFKEPTLLTKMIPRTTRMVFNAPASPAVAPANIPRTYQMDFAAIAAANDTTTTTNVAPAKRVSTRTRRMPAKVSEAPEAKPKVPRKVQVPVVASVVPVPIVSVAVSAPTVIAPPVVPSPGPFAPPQAALSPSSSWVLCSPISAPVEEAPVWLTGKARVEAYRRLLGSCDSVMAPRVRDHLVFQYPFYRSGNALGGSPCPARGSKSDLVFNGRKSREAPACPGTPSPLFSSRIPPPTPMLRSGASPYVSRGVLSPSARRAPPSSTNVLAPFSPGRGLPAPTRFLARGAGITVEAPDRAGKNDWLSFAQSSLNVTRAQNFTKVTASEDIHQSEPASEEFEASIHSSCSSSCCSAVEAEDEDGDGSCDMELEEISLAVVAVVSESASLEETVDAQTPPTPFEEKVEVCASPVQEETQTTEIPVASENHEVVVVAKQEEPRALPRLVAPPLWDGKTDLPVEVISAMAQEHRRWQEEEEPLFDPEGNPWIVCRHVTCYRHGRRAMCRARSRFAERGDVWYRPRNLAAELEATYGKNWQQLFFVAPPPSVEKTEDEVDFSVW